MPALLRTPEAALTPETCDRTINAQVRSAVRNLLTRQGVRIYTICLFLHSLRYV
jgi:hypothetical protein